MKIIKTSLFLLLFIACFTANSQSIVVTYLSGQDNCNAPPEGGTYAVTGTLNGKNQYSKDANHIIEWNGSQWIFKSYTSLGGWSTLYTNSSNTTVPPCVGWTATFGCFIPTFSGGCGNPLVATATKTNVTCNGGSNGVASVSVSGGTSPYTYSWAPSGGSGATASGLSAGTYTCTITDAGAQSTTAVVTITQPSAFSISSSTTNVACNGGSNGAAAVSVSGATAPYFYSWSPSGGTGSTATGLSAGSYTCTITDNKSCVTTKVFTITQPSALVTSTAVTNVACNGGSNGVAAITASGGAGGYTYSWSTGATTSVITGLTAGVRTCTVTDANGCTASKATTVTQPSAIVTSTSVTNVACNGGSNGVAAITASGGAVGYTYSWSTGATTSVITGLTAGVKTCTVTDANNCTASNSVTITQPTALATSTAVTNVSCNGGSTGSATLTVSGGTAPYSYMASNGYTTSTLPSLVAGTYNYTVTDANSCTKTQALTITQPTTLSLTASANNATICSGASSTLTANGTGGTGTITYTWVGGPTNSTYVVSPTSPTNYTVNITDANSCSKSATVNVSANVCAAAEALNFDGTDDRVNIGNSITSILSGGTKVSVEAWVKPTNLSGLGCIVGNYQTGAGANLQILLRRSGNSYYEFWVGNGSNWYQTTSVATPTVNVWQHVAATWNGTVASIYVNGVLSGTTTPATSTMGSAGSGPVWIGGNNISENFTGNIDEVRIWNVVRTQCEINTYKNCEISTTATGLLANYHFNQGNDAGANTSVTTLTDATAANTGTLTNFNLTGVTSNWVASGGVTSGSVTPANLAITVGSTATNSVICMGNSTTLSGTGANTYVWTGGVTNAVAFTPTVTNTYTVTGTNTLTGCTNTAVNTVTVNTLPSVVVNTTNALCNGGTGSATVIATGGTSPYSYLASNGSTLSAQSGLMPGTYNYTVTDNKGCAKTQTLSITQPSAINVSTTANNFTICSGASSTLTANATGGTGTKTYSWISGPNSSTNIVSPSSTTVYTVNATDANNCVKTSTVEVAVNALPTVTVNSGAVCVGQSFTMTPAGADTYVYSNGTDVVTPTANDSYTVTGTNTVTGCSSTAVSSVTVNTLPTVTVNSGAVCAGQSFTMTPSGATTYTYSNGTDVVIPTANDSYTVTGTDANGCENTDVSSVTVNALPVLTAVTNNTLLCAGQTATLTVSGATTYTWSTSANTTTVAVSPTVQTTYTVNGTDANGCSNNTTVTQNVSACTGIATLSNDASINVYPNPNNGLFVIELTTVSKVTVTNALGQVVIAETFEAGKHTVNINNEMTGVYFVKVMTNNGQQTIKVIKE